jgi:hypothetical protein
LKVYTGFVAFKSATGPNLALFYASLDTLYHIQDYMHLEIMSALLNLVIYKHGLYLIVDAGVLYGVAFSMAT